MPIAVWQCQYCSRVFATSIACEYHEAQHRPPSVDERSAACEAAESTVRRQAADAIESVLRTVAKLEKRVARLDPCAQDAVLLSVNQFVTENYGRWVREVTATHAGVRELCQLVLDQSEQASTRAQAILPTLSRLDVDADWLQRLTELAARLHEVSLRTTTSHATRPANREGSLPAMPDIADVFQQLFGDFMAKKEEG